MNKKVLISILGLAALFGGGVLGVKAVKAEDSNSYSYPPIVEKLVEKFGLKEDEVTGVFDEIYQERQQKMQAHMESKLDEAVNDGVITAEQKQALLNKHTEMQEKQRQLREEWQRWMEESGIDFGKLASYRVGFGGWGFVRGHRFDGF